MRLIYFSPVLWESYAQRPHFTVRYFLHVGGAEVLWVNPYPTRLPRLGDLRRLEASSAPPWATPALPGLRVLAVPALPLEPLPGGPFLNRNLLWRSVLRSLCTFAEAGETVIGIGKPSGLACFALKHVPHVWSFFDVMDNFPEFYAGLSRLTMAQWEASIARTADAAFFSSSFLKAKFGRQGVGGDKVLNASGIDTASPVRGGSPGDGVLGYVGTIGRWFDWDCVNQIARAFPSTRVRLIGPLFSRPRRFASNIEVLPPCRQEEVSLQMACFRAGLIPFRKCSLTDGVDPIKYYEYRALGLPVLSTRFGEMASRSSADGVFFVDDPEGRRASVQAALAHRAAPAETRRFAVDNYWFQRFRSAGLFSQLLSAQQGSSARPAAVPVPCGP